MRLNTQNTADVSHRYFSIRRLYFDQDASTTNEVELVYVKRGSLTVYDGKSNVINEGRFYYIRPYVLRSFTDIAPDSRIYVFRIDIYGFCNETSSELIINSMGNDLIDEIDALFIKELFELALFETVKPSPNLFRLFVLISGITLLFGEKMAAIQSNPEELFDANCFSGCIHKVINYINEHYNEPWNVKMLADIAYVTPEHLCRNFKKHIGMTIGNYINGLKIEKSIADLINTDNSIEQISLKHGFNNPKPYYTNFQKLYHMTPMQYRQNVSKKTKAGIHSSSESNISSAGRTVK